MKRFRLSLLTHLFLLTGLFFSGCTSGNKKGNAPVAGAKQDTMKPANTTVAPTNVQPRSNTVTIEIKGMKFNPEELTVHKGDTVVWVNNDLTGHCVTQSTKKWTSSTIAPGATWKKVIRETSDYYCAIHMVMKGHVKVE